MDQQLRSFEDQSAQFWWSVVYDQIADISGHEACSALREYSDLHGMLDYSYHIDYSYTIRDSIVLRSVKLFPKFERNHPIKIRSRISPERMEISKTGKTSDRQRFLPGLMKKVP